MMNNFSLKVKMISAFVAVACCLPVVGAINRFSMNDVVFKYKHVANENLPNTRWLARMRAAFYETRVGVNRYGFPDNSPQEMKEIADQIDAGFEAYADAEKKYNQGGFADGEKEKYEAIQKTMNEFRPLVANIEKLMSTGKAENRATFSRMMNEKFRPLSKIMTKQLTEVISFQSDEAAKWTALAEKSATFANYLSMGLIGAGFAFALLLGYFISANLSKGLTLISTQLADGANQVASASRQIAGASTELSESATQQAAALQETVASLEEVSAMVNKNSENAKKSQNSSETSRLTAVKGKTAVGDMIQSIEDINQSNTQIMKQIESSNHEMAEIVKVIAEIGNKTKVINDIVFQTKLLSFNASVEAARAGEHGKGFAVVAEEVGNLAQMSGNAAKEISAMLDSSIHKVEGIVSNTKAKVEGLVVIGKQKVEVGTQTAKRCGEVLDEILTSVEEVNQMVGEIATASQEQAQGVQEINKAMAQLDQVTQQNTTVSQESAAASEQLSGQAETLKDVVMELTATVTGKHEGAPVQLAIQHTSHAPAKTSAKKKAASHPSNVVALPKRSASNSHMKKAVGSDYIPSEDDSRFEDV
ncbi:MAG: methyl-accepting chemotaxis protein [Methylotenera sp.]|nr:methyl-accepting chemotaxis protein [Oligoflexia bacterium]